jgi:hypothetical protein
MAMALGEDLTAYESRMRRDRVLPIYVGGAADTRVCGWTHHRRESISTLPPLAVSKSKYNDMCHSHRSPRRRSRHARRHPPPRLSVHFRPCMPAAAAAPRCTPLIPLRPRPRLPTPGPVHSGAQAGAGAAWPKHLPTLIVGAQYTLLLLLLLLLLRRRRRRLCRLRWLRRRRLLRMVCRWSISSTSAADRPEFTSITATCLGIWASAPPTDTSAIWPPSPTSSSTSTTAPSLPGIVLLYSDASSLCCSKLTPSAESSR